jgi:Uma2 family endonuclease
MLSLNQTLSPTLLERRYRFTVQEFEFLCENGILQENQVELLDGFVLDTVITNLHYKWTLELHEQLLEALQEKAKVTRLTPIQLSKNTRLSPDFSIIPFHKYSSQIPNPQDLALVIEIGDTTLETDKGLSLERYAQAGIKEYWVIDAKCEKLEIYREPEGMEYRSKQTIDRDTKATMLEFPDVQLKWWI